MTEEVGSGVPSTLSHVTTGAGYPAAAHSRLTSSPSHTSTELGGMMKEREEAVPEGAVRERNKQMRRTIPNKVL